jgi:pantoate--beta-alanine ligase
MRIIHSLDEMTETARGWLTGGPVGFITIKSDFHDGHRALIRAAQEACETCVVGIIGALLPPHASKDGSQQQQDLARDLKLLDSINVDIVFIPRVAEMYPPNFATHVTPVGPLTQRLEGVINGPYLRNLVTIMTKLLLLVRPDIAYFGQKDAQLVAVIQQLVRDLNIDVSLRIIPTVRESDGLAISTRNRYLSQGERQAAPVLYRALLAGKALIDGGERRRDVIEKAIADLVATAPLIRLEYVAVCNPETFDAVDNAGSGTLIAIAAQAGNVHLIDNILWMSDGQWRL